MIKKFYSVGGTSQIDIEFQKVDFINSTDIFSLIKDFSDGFVFTAKRAKSVYMTPAKIEEKIDNRDRFEISGRTYVFKTEMRQVSQRDIETRSMIALYNNGYKQIYKGEKFEENFILTDEIWGMYTPVDYEKKFVKVKKHIYFQTLWGEMIYAPKGSFLCIENLKMREFFIVPNTYFKLSYLVAKELGDIDNLTDLF